MSGTTITLGGREFAIAPLKLGQLRALLGALDDLSGKTGGATIDAAARVIHAGLSRAMPELTLDAVLEFEATMEELTEAVATILDAAGLRRAADGGARETAPGESMPGESMPVAGRRTASA